MKKSHIKYLLVLFVGFMAVLIYISTGSEESVQDIIASDETEDIVKDAIKEKTQVIIPKSSLPMTTKLLPFANSEIRVEPTTHIVLHFTSNALAKPHDPYQVDDVYNVFKDYGVSAHYIIDRAGEISQLVYEDRVAYHAGEGIIEGYPEYEKGLNHYSIGIELLAIGTREEMLPIIDEASFNKIDPNLLGYTEEQYTTLNTLIDDIIIRNPSIQKSRLNIVGHDDYTDRKTDPGRLFEWNKIGF